MEALESNIDVNSQDFKENREHYLKLVEDLREKIAWAQAGGGEKAIDLHKSRNKGLDHAF